MNENSTAAAHAHTHAHEPFVRMIKRDSIPRGKAYMVRGIAILGALVTGGILILALGNNPFLVYRDMVTGSLGTTSALRETARIAVPLLVTGLGIGVAFKMQFWNIGGEGQIIMGAVAASYFALFQHRSIPAPLLIIVMAVVSVIAGGLWGLIPAVFKARWGTNETLFTLMLNYIALELVRYFQFGPWRDPSQLGFPKMAMFTNSARLPQVFGVHIGWVFALVLVALMYFYMRKSKQGYEITVVGESVPTAHYAGINVGRVFMRTMFLSGALCGFTGFLTVAGANYTLSEAVTNGVGFTSITVAWLAGLNPVIMAVISVFIAMLEKGSNTIQTNFKIPSSAAEILTGLILLFMLACEFFLNYQLVFRKGKGAGHV